MLFDHAHEPAPPRARRAPDVPPAPTPRPGAGARSPAESRPETRDVPPDRAPHSLDLAEAAGREWDIVMTRDDRWVRVSTGITDPDEVRRQLHWYRLGNHSVTFHVIERTTTLREQLVDEDDLRHP